MARKIEDVVRDLNTVKGWLANLLQKDAVDDPAVAEARGWARAYEAELAAARKAEAKGR